MELILIFAFIAWVVWLFDSSDRVDAGKAAYLQYQLDFGCFGADCPLRFERYLIQREASLDQETQALTQYLAENPPPPKVTP